MLTSGPELDPCNNTLGDLLDFSLGKRNGRAHDERERENILLRTGETLAIV